MFDTNEKIGKILGTPQGQGRGLGFGKGAGPLHKGLKRDNFNINPNNVLFELQKLLDRLPEVKSAKGSLTIKLADGQVKTLKLEYNE